MKSTFMKQSHQHINGDSGSDEYYTPIEIIEAARRVMGGIDLDPASSGEANARAKAARFFTQSDDGLSQQWKGRVWMNHPFGRETNRPWIAKLAHEYEQGGVTEAVCITFASTSEQWFRPLLERPQCFLTKRTNYFLRDGTLKTGVTKGSVITYFGENVAAFAREFAPFGIIKISYAMT